MPLFLQYALCQNPDFLKPPSFKPPDTLNQNSYSISEYTQFFEQILLR